MLTNIHPVTFNIYSSHKPTKDGYQPVISNLDIIQQLCCLSPECGCKNQLVCAWDALFTVSVCWHEFSSISKLSHLFTDS